MPLIRSGIRRILSGYKQGARKYSVHAPQRVCEQKNLGPVEGFVVGFQIGLLGMFFYEVIRCVVIPGAMSSMSFMRGHHEESAPSEKAREIETPGDDGN